MSSSAPYLLAGGVPVGVACALLEGIPPRTFAGTGRRNDRTHRDSLCLEHRATGSRQFVAHWAIRHEVRDLSSRRCMDIHTCHHGCPPGRGTDGFIFDARHGHSRLDAGEGLGLVDSGREPSCILLAS